MIDIPAIPTDAKDFARWRKRQVFVTDELRTIAYTVERDLENMEKPGFADVTGMRQAVADNIAKLAEALKRSERTGR